PIPIEVSPAKTVAAPPPTTPAPTAPESGLALSNILSSEEALLTLDYRPEEPRPVGYGILRSPAFIGLNLLAALVLGGGAFLLYRSKRRREDPDYVARAAAKKSLKEARQAYLKALRDDDADTFYKQGQNAIRQAATLRTGHPMQSAESTRIEALLDGQMVEDCRAFFAAADAHRFGGNTEKTHCEAQEQLERILKAL
ncbi:MAG TPA: hypothetical protein VJ952_05850, partial [Opitutales bacterium]|nr:hypothetical protein [Opitutales bacterium]